MFENLRILSRVEVLSLFLHILSGANRLQKMPIDQSALTARAKNLR